MKEIQQNKNSFGVVSKWTDLNLLKKLMLFIYLNVAGSHLQCLSRHLYETLEKDIIEKDYAKSSREADGCLQAGLSA